ncbi:MAG: carboxypeptidase regulatory-like domain-containing protein [Chloroflexota bacterium]|nr:carboxypeptidase regulatory-like domain-containing protein [Chloroflexota bacterium]
MKQQFVRALVGLTLVLASFAGSAGSAALAAPPMPPATPVAADAAGGCAMNFSDVPAGSWFHDYVQYLYCTHVVGGYGSEFRPTALTTRSQLAKMISLALKWPLTPSGDPHFTDVPADHPFYTAVEAASAHGIISGYTCGGTGEPCDSAHRPYFRPYAPVTRAQLAKMVVLGQGWSPVSPAQPSFNDVSPSSVFYGFIEAATAQGVISGYANGGFGPAASASRAQLAKMLTITLTPPNFDQSDNESELAAEDDSAEPLPDDLDPAADSVGLVMAADRKALSVAANATISGTLLTSDGNPLFGATVAARPLTGGSVITTTTDSAGSYSLSVPAGSYNVRAALLDSFYPVTANPANPVVVADGGSAVASFRLTEGGVIAGTVADSTTHSPVADARTWAVTNVLPPQAYAGSSSDSQGQYRIVVPAGVLHAWAEKDSATYPRTPSLAGPAITVTVGMTTTANFALTPGGVVVGHITDASTAAPLPGSRVWARHDPLATAYGAPLTDSAGAYRLVIPGGTPLRLHAHNIDGLYPRTPYSDNPISVTVGLTITADIALTKGGLIQGIITGADSGLPLAGARAIAHQPVEQRYWSWWSDAHGQYQVVVPAGSWNLFGRSDWQGYYRTPAANNPISVTVGSTVSVNLALGRGAIIQGRVTDAASGSPLPYSHVWANQPGPDGPNYGWPITGLDGRYLLAVPAGTWGVYARNDQQGYPRTGYPSNPITTTVGSTYTADIAMTLGAIIHGTLTDADSGAPIQLAHVWARAPGGGLGYGSPRTDERGRYVLSVPAGTWRLMARDLDQFYPRTAYPNNPITTTVGSATVASWTMRRGGLITGQITDAATGAGLPLAQVWARALDGNVHDSDYTRNADGTYRLVVPAGDYNLRAADVLQGYPSLVCPLNPVHVVPGGTTPASWALTRW